MKTKRTLRIYPLCVMGMAFFLLFACKKDDENTTTEPAPTPVPINTVTDYDGNVYHYVTIGTQVWMVENLKVTHYRNGDSIPNVPDDTQWSALTTGAYSDYENTASNSSVYGRLYNWFVVSDSRNICPAGWHIPSVTEFNTLISYLGGTSAAGGKLKETGTAHWLSPNTAATNETGFTALPGGTRNNSGSFSNAYNHGYWWTGTEMDPTNAWSYNINYNHPDIYNTYDLKPTGFSIRCIKD